MLTSPTCGNSTTCKIVSQQLAEQVTSATESAKENIQKRWICPNPPKPPNRTLIENCTERETATKTATNTAEQNSSDQWQECDMDVWAENRHVPGSDFITRSE